MKNTKHLDTCNLIQACEYIAFKWLPLSTINAYKEKRYQTRNTSEYHTEITNAANTLLKSLQEKQITATGKPYFTELFYLDTNSAFIPCDKHAKQEYDNNIKKLRQESQSHTTIPVIHSLDLQHNKILVLNNEIHEYTDIQIQLKDLQSLFDTVSKRGRKPVLSLEDQDKLKEFIKSHKYTADKELYIDAQNYVKNTLGINISYEGVRKYINNLKSTH